MSYPSIKRSSSVEILNSPEHDKRARLNSHTSDNDILIIDDNDDFNFEHNIQLLKNIFPQINEDRIRHELRKYENNSNAINLVMDDLSRINNELVSTFNQDEQDLAKIVNVIPDCDPDYIKQQLMTLPQNTLNRTDLIVNQIMEAKSYPKLKDTLLKQKRIEKLNSFLNLIINVKDFVKEFPNPMQFFYDTKRNPSENYKNHCRTYLQNEFKHITNYSIEQTFKNNNYNFTVTYHQLNDAIRGSEQALMERCRKKFFNLSDFNNNVDDGRFYSIGFQRKKNKYEFQYRPRPEIHYPDSLDEKFFKEVWFTKNEIFVKDYIAKEEASRKSRFEKAKLENTLLECSCCCDNEFLREDMVSCDENHLYCRTCIKTYAETKIGDSQYKFPCFGDQCNSEFSLQTLKEILDSNVYERLLKRIQTEEIKTANLDCLESCPHCDYSVIFENPDEKVFACQNPECLKVTCRKCKEPDHLPLRCDEIENKSEVDMRTWIENKVTESIIRVCHKCGKRFYKEEGCNMMHCVCGASICYICRQPITGYNHFSPKQKANPDDPKPCPQFSDVKEVHKHEMEEAYKKAYEEYIALHPEKKDVKLKHDPKKAIDELQVKKSQNTVQPGIARPYQIQDFFRRPDFLLNNGANGFAHNQFGNFAQYMPYRDQHQVNNRDRMQFLIEHQDALHQQFNQLRPMQHVIQRQEPLNPPLQVPLHQQFNQLGPMQQQEPAHMNQELFVPNFQFEPFVMPHQTQLRQDQQQDPIQMDQQHFESNFQFTPNTRFGSNQRDNNQL